MQGIPVILNNFNRLTCTKNLAEQFEKLGYNNIFILDNGSDYPPLMEWYKKCHYTIIHLDGNHGEMGYWSINSKPRFKEYKYILYTDSDVSLNPKTPKDFVSRLIEIGEKHNYKKVGCAINIYDLPYNQYTDHVIRWEAKFWKNEIEESVYVADIGGTLSVFKSSDKFDYKALRVGGDFTISHYPWYVDFDKLDEEEKFFLSRCRNDFSTYKKYYESYKMGIL